MRNMTRSFNYPITGFFGLETAGITYKILHLAELIFSAGNPQYFFTFIPQCHFAFTAGTIAVGIKRPGKSYPVFTTECFICQSSDRTNIDHISRKIIFYDIFYIGGYLGCIAAAQNTMYALISDLIGNIYTSVT